MLGRDYGNTERMIEKLELVVQICHNLSVLELKKSNN